MEITKREIIASISIIAILLILGVIIADKISDNVADDNAKYNKALKIEDKELFIYSMKTNVGDAFVYGELETLDPVTYEEIDGEYSYIKKIKEEYVMKTRTVTHTDSEGHSYTTTEVYWEWDEVDRETKESEKAKFLGVEFDYSKFIKPNDKYITTIDESYDIRYVYYGSPTNVKGTIFTSLNNNDIEEGLRVYEDMDTDQAQEYLTSSNSVLFFWIVWIVVIVLCVYGFYYLENDWLNFN